MLLVSLMFFASPPIPGAISTPRKASNIKAWSAVASMGNFAHEQARRRTDATTGTHPRQIFCRPGDARRQESRPQWQTVRRRRTAGLRFELWARTPCGNGTVLALDFAPGGGEGARSTPPGHAIPLRLARQPYFLSAARRRHARRH